MEWGGGIEAVVRRYSDTVGKKPIRDIDIGYLKYDWNLNET